MLKSVCFSRLFALLIACLIMPLGVCSAYDCDSAGCWCNAGQDDVDSCVYHVVNQSHDFNWHNKPYQYGSGGWEWIDRDGKVYKLWLDGNYVEAWVPAENWNERAEALLETGYYDRSFYGITPRVGYIRVYVPDWGATVEFKAAYYSSTGTRQYTVCVEKNDSPRHCHIEND